MQQLILFSVQQMLESHFQAHRFTRRYRNEFYRYRESKCECGFLVFRSWKIKIILEQNQFASHTKIIDLGNDFRLTKDKELIANLLFMVYLN
jgi:hypothetical protein